MSPSENINAINEVVSSYFDKTINQDRLGTSITTMDNWDSAVTNAGAATSVKFNKNPNYTAEYNYSGPSHPSPLTAKIAIDILNIIVKTNPIDRKALKVISKFLNDFKISKKGLEILSPYLTILKLQEVK